MDPLALTAAGIVVGVQVGLFAWLKHDISDASRADWPDLNAGPRGMAETEGFEPSRLCSHKHKSDGV